MVRGSPISITIHTSTLKQPSPPPSLIAPAVPAVLPQPAGEDDRSRSPFCHSSCFHMLVLPVRPCSCFLVSLARASSASSASMLVLRCNSCFLRCNSCFVVTRASFVVTRSILSQAQLSSHGPPTRSPIARPLQSSPTSFVTDVVPFRALQRRASLVKVTVAQSIRRE